MGASRAITTPIDLERVIRTHHPIRRAG